MHSLNVGRSHRRKFNVSRRSIVSSLVAWAGVVLFFVTSAPEFAPALVAGLTVLVLTIVSPPMGAATLLVFSPFMAVVPSLAGFGPLYVWIPAFLIGLLCSHSGLEVLKKGVERLDLVLFGFVLLLLFSAIFLSEFRMPSVLVTTLVALMIIVHICIRGSVVHVNGGGDWLLLGLVVSGVLAVLVAIGMGATDGGRLSLHGEAGGVRDLANAASFALIGLFLMHGPSIFGEARITSVRFPMWLSAIVAIVAVSGVVLSVSRGVIVALAVAVCVAAILFIVRSLRRFRVNRSGLYVCVSVFFGVAGVLVSIPFLERVTDGAIDRLILFDASSDRSVEIRGGMFAAAFDEFGWENWLFGRGAGTFDLYSGGPYEHSVVVSILSAGGGGSNDCIRAIYCSYSLDSMEAREV